MSPCNSIIHAALPAKHDVGPSNNAGTFLLAQPEIPLFEQPMAVMASEMAKIATYSIWPLCGQLG